MTDRRSGRDRVFRIAAVLAVSAWSVPAWATDIGLVVGVHGKPSATDPIGHWRLAKVLQGVHDGETVVFDQGDQLVVCNNRRRAAVQIDGPGTVSIGATAVAVLAGSPRVTEAGPCDDSTAADANGGVIMRGLPRLGPPAKK